MVRLEKNDPLMLARQLPLKTVALILAGRAWYPSERFDHQARQTGRSLWW